MLVTWFWCQNQCFGVWGIIWDHLGEALDKPEGQELGAGAVGGQEGLQEVKFFTLRVTQLLSMLETWFWWQNQCFGVWGII